MVWKVQSGCYINGSFEPIEEGIYCDTPPVVRLIQETAQMCASKGEPKVFLREIDEYCPPLRRENFLSGIWKWMSGEGGFFSGLDMAANSEASRPGNVSFGADPNW